MATLPLSIIIVNWNSKEYLRQCVTSIIDGTCGIEYEIIVVDSGSFDGSGQMLQRSFPQVRFVQIDSNVGFGCANNRGAMYARGDVLLLLNPDTEVRGNAIGRLYRAFCKLRNPGAIGCRLLNSDGSLQISCVQPFPTIANQILNAQVLQRCFPRIGIWLTAMTFKDAKSPVAVEAVSGACMLIHHRLFDRVGGFSAEYFMYGEDLDLCFKTRVAGFTNYHVPGVRIIHHGGGSTGHSRFSEIMMRESIFRLLAKTRGNVYGLGYRCGITGAAAFRVGILLLVFPAAVCRGSKARWRAAFARWTSVFRWGIGLESWVREYKQPAHATAVARA